jgi:hypothetical protein
MMRVRRMDRREIAFRSSAAARQLAGRVSTAVSTPRWDRGRLTASLSEGVPASALARHFQSRPRLFPLHPSDAAHLRGAILQRDPLAADLARRLADQILDGRLNVLGYRDVLVGAPINWHRDPVHDRVAPVRFWASVRYLDHALGDHKIIWEINRHQHWMALGRAAWLTGDTRYCQAVTSQLRGWLHQNPPLMGINWASMLELAFRSLSWIWALQFCSACEDGDDSWIGDLLVGVDRQLEHVRQNLSYYFSPNTHLLGEALALYVAGCSLPELRHAAAWRHTGRRVLLDEIVRQVHVDGGHVELSAHYHRYALDFYLLALSVARLAQDEAAAAVFEGVARRLACYARALADDRGYLPLIGDDDGGQLFPVCGRPAADATPSLVWAAELLNDASLAPEGEAPEEVCWLLARVPERRGGDNERVADRSAVPITVFPDSGYVIVRTPRRDHAVFDVGHHGFLNGGHAHADALSIVLNIAGRPVFIDPGTATYTMDRTLRNRMRAAGSHNSVLVDGRQHAIPAGPFQWQSTTNAHLEHTQTLAHGTWASAEHHGYAPLVHRRGVFISDDGLVVVVDAIDGDAEIHEAEVRWHLDPAWEYQPGTGGARLIHPSDAELRVTCTSELQGIRGGDELGWCAPVYGQLLPTWSLFAIHRGRCPLEMVTVLCEGSVPPSLALNTESRGSARRLGVTVGREGRTDTFEFRGHDTPVHERQLAPSLQAGAR